MQSHPDPLPPILPVGTKVVLRVAIAASVHSPGHPAGSTCTIVEAPLDPEHSYRVVFPSGAACSVRRKEIQPLTRFQLGENDDAAVLVDLLTEHGLRKNIIYSCVIGSRAYGLDRDGSDTDRRGIYLAPASMQWSIYGVPDQLEDQAAQECYWELQKFIVLALKANPNVLEVLHSPLVEVVHPIAQELRDRRQIFVSKLVYQTFNGYAISQFRKMQQDIRATGSVKWKHAMHLIRLLYAGIEVLRTGELQVHVGSRREELLAIRDGLVPWGVLDERRVALHREFERAYELSKIPERPGYEEANRILIEARRWAAREEGLV